ncbi:MAG: trigger factor [Mailhella sp.]|nr:trigger factor [Mailhella sp.]
MAYSIEVVSSISRKISVTVPAEEVNAALNAEARKVGASVALPGFRKGKAPLSTIIKNFRGDVYSRGAEALIDVNVQKALEAENLRPVSQPKLEADEGIDFNTDFSFSVTFEILPEVKLPEDLAALTVEMPSTEPTDEDVAALAENIRKSMATLEELTEARLPQNGDVVNINVDGDIEGKPVPGMKIEDYSIQLADPQGDKELSELDKIIRGLRPGEEGTGAMTFPEDHPEEQLRGKTVDLRVKLNKISRQVLPELDEEFAAKVGFGNLEALNKMIREQAGRNKAQAARAQAERKLLDSVLEGQEFDIPEVILNEQRASQEAEVRGYLEQQGMTPEAIDESIANMADDLAAQAKGRARDFVVLTSLAVREKLEVTEQELDMQIMQLASQYKEDFKKLRDTVIQNGYVNVMRNSILTGKAMAMMFDKAQKTAPAAE